VVIGPELFAGLPAGLAFLFQGDVFVSQDLNITGKLYLALFPLVLEK
jgi:hypothetical protein